MIARSTLLNFAKHRLPAAKRRVVEAHLRAWFAELARASWANSAELKAQFTNASIVSAERVVFNIKGNEYRLIVAVNYSVGVVLIKWLGTHREYDRVDALRVEYEKERYADSSHPH